MVINMSCTGGNHDLREIMTKPCYDAPDAEYVVRWCAECGAIVIDVDVDERTAPGRCMKMCLPKCSQPKS